MIAKNNTKNSGHTAAARAMNLQVSTKHCIEICSSLRYKKTSFAKKFLEEVSSLKRAVPFRKFTRDVAHKAGMSSGRFPKKAAKEILKLINSVEANAQAKGLNTSNLKIIKILANRAAIPITGGRHRTGTKRTHVEVEVKEGKVEAKKQEVKKEKKVERKGSEIKKTEEKVEEKTVEAKPTPSIQKEEAKVEETPAPKSQEKAVEKPEIKKEKVPVKIGKQDLEEQSKEETKKVEKPAEKAEEKVKLAEEKPAAPSKEEVVKAPVQETVKPLTPAEEPSPAELLKKAQERAEKLNKKEKEAEDAKEVSNLYKELQKKGSLRHKRDTQ